MGSVTVQTTASGTAVAQYTYEPFGVTRVTSGGTVAAADPYRYGGSNGAYTDPFTGLIKMGARYYNAGQGRFTQPDPSGQEANAYPNAGSDPINGVDPSGLDAVDDVAGIATTVLGAARGAAEVTGVGAPVGRALGLASAAAGGLQACHYCSNGADNCGQSLTVAGIGFVTFGAGAALGEGTRLGFDILGTTDAAGGAASGFYCDSFEC